MDSVCVVKTRGRQGVVAGDAPSRLHLEDQVKACSRRTGTGGWGVGCHLLDVAPTLGDREFGDPGIVVVHARNLLWKRCIHWAVVELPFFACVPLPPQSWTHTSMACAIPSSGRCHAPPSLRSCGSSPESIRHGLPGRPARRILLTDQAWPTVLNERLITA